MESAEGNALIETSVASSVLMIPGTVVRPLKRLVDERGYLLGCPMEVNPF